MSDIFLQVAFHSADVILDWVVAYDFLKQWQEAEKGVLTQNNSSEKLYDAGECQFEDTNEDRARRYKVYFAATLVFILLPQLALTYRSVRNRHKPAWRHFGEHGKIIQGLHHLAVLFNLGIVVETVRAFNVKFESFQRRHKSSADSCGCTQSALKKKCGCALPLVAEHCGRECKLDMEQMRCILRRQQLEVDAPSSLAFSEMRSCGASLESAGNAVLQTFSVLIGDTGNTRTIILSITFALLSISAALVGAEETHCAKFFHELHPFSYAADRGFYWKVTVFRIAETCSRVLALALLLAAAYVARGLQFSISTVISIVLAAEMFFVTALLIYAHFPNFIVGTKRGATYASQHMTWKRRGKKLGEVLFTWVPFSLFVYALPLSDVRRGYQRAIQLYYTKYVIGTGALLAVTLWLQSVPGSAVGCGAGSTTTAGIISFVVTCSMCAHMFIAGTGSRCKRSGTPVVRRSGVGHVRYLLEQRGIDGALMYFECVLSQRKAHYADRGSAREKQIGQSTTADIRSMFMKACTCLAELQIVGGRSKAMAANGGTLEWCTKFALECWKHAKIDATKAREHNGIQLNANEDRRYRQLCADIDDTERIGASMESSILNDARSWNKHHRTCRGCLPGLPRPVDKEKDPIWAEIYQRMSNYWKEDSAQLHMRTNRASSNAIFDHRPGLGYMIPDDAAEFQQQNPMHQPQPQPKSQGATNIDAEHEKETSNSSIAVVQATQTQTL